MSDTIDNLMQSTVAEMKRVARGDLLASDTREFIRDATHMQEIMAEVFTSAMPPKADIDKWIAAGHRVVVTTEAPFTVEGYMNQQDPCDVRTFRMSVRNLLKTSDRPPRLKDWPGTGIYHLERTQVDGRWELARFRIEVGTEGRADVRVATSANKLEGMDGDMEMYGGSKMDDYTTRTVRTLTPVLAWIDRVNAPPNHYNSDGKPADKIQMVNAPAAPAAPQQVFIMQPGQNPSVDELVAMVTKKAKIEQAEAESAATEKAEVAAAEKAISEGRKPTAAQQAYYDRAKKGGDGT